MVRFVVHPGSQSERASISRSPSVVVIIPARYASSRFPGKALADIAGRPMIEHVYHRAAAASRVASVIVATDDTRIRDAVKEFGGAAEMTSAAHPSGTDRLAEVARRLDCDLVVNVQGDEPLVEPAMIEQAIAAFDETPALAMSTLCSRLTHPADFADPNIVKVVVDREGYALYFSRAAIPYRTSIPGVCEGGATPSAGMPRPEAVKECRGHDTGAEAGRPALRHIGLYVYRRDVLLTLASLEPTPLERLERLEQLRALEHGFRIKTLLTSYEPVGVDTPEDLERVRRILATKPKPTTAGWCGESSLLDPRPRAPARLSRGCTAASDRFAHTQAVQARLAGVDS